MRRAKIVADELAKFRNSNDLKAFRDALRDIALDASGDPKARISAIKEWHDRAYGKPAQEVIVSEDGESASIEEQMRQLEELRARYPELLSVAGKDIGHEDA